MGSNKVCSIGLDNHTFHFDRAQMDRVCSRWSTLIERAGHRSVRVCSTWPTLTEPVGHRSIRSCSRCPVLFQGGTFARGNKTATQRTVTEEPGHRSDRAWSRWLTLTEQAGHRSLSRLFEVAVFVPGNKTWTLSPRFTPRCSTRRIEEKKSVSLLTSWLDQPYGGRVESR